MNDSQSTKPNPSIFFVPGAAPISEDITSKHFESAEHPREDIWSLLSRSITAEWLKKTGMTRSELLQQAMETPTVPYEPVWETTELFCPNCGAKGLLVEEGVGDYYQGSQHRCESCMETCYIQ